MKYVRETEAFLIWKEEANEIQDTHGNQGSCMRCLWTHSAHPTRPTANVVGQFIRARSGNHAREYGAALMGNFVLTWFARNAEESVARRAIVGDLFAYDAIAFVAILLIQLSGGLNLLGWSIVAIYLFFALGFGYFLLPRQRVA
jgi:hypothetical protein